MENQHLLTTTQLASILQIKEHSLGVLASSGKIPFTFINSESNDSAAIRFNTGIIVDWLDRGSIFKAMDEKAYIERLQKEFQERFPDAMRELRAFDLQISEPRKPKGYSLIKVKNKKMGFKYYVRYIEGGQLIRSCWCTQTNNQEKAIQFALENRERILAKYYDKKNKQKTACDLYEVMENYYTKDSVHLLEDMRRGRSIGDDTVRSCHNTIIKKWVPYLKENKIKKINEIDTPLLVKFQNKLLSGGIKPQTINHYMSHISTIFDHLVAEGASSTNPFKNLASIKVNEDNYEDRGCYNVNDIKGVFEKAWENELSRLLCLLVYTTNMRPVEIGRIQVNDIIQIDNYHFIDIPKSKTKNGVRIVPLHDFVYAELMKYIAQEKKADEDFIFKKKSTKKVQGIVWRNAYVEMGKLLGYEEKKLEAENITFYSGRHFWKTLMNSEELGDVEEVFMGHKVSSNIAERYNHRDKQGMERIIKKATEVFAILDKRIFRDKNPADIEENQLPLFK
jgi:integrase